MDHFKTGASVRLLFDIKNDGTFFGRKRGEIIQPAGALGYVANRNDLADLTVYEVHFLESSSRVGCREKELISGDEVWLAPIFKKRASVAAKIDLTYEKQLIVRRGERGRVTVVRYQKGEGYLYEVKFSEKTNQYCLLKESQLVSSSNSESGAGS